MFTCFLNGIFLVYGPIFLVLLSRILHKKSEEFPWLVYILSFHWVMVIHTYFCTKGYDYVNVLSVYWFLLVINTGCPKKLLKMGNIALLISSSNFAKTPYKCVHRRQYVFLVFSNFSETPRMKVGFDVRISPV